MDLVNLYLSQMYILASRKVAFAVCNPFIHRASTIHLKGLTGQEWGSSLNSENSTSRGGSHFYETI